MQVPLLLSSSQSSQLIEKIIYWILYSNEMALICFWVTVIAIVFIVYKVKEKKFKNTSYYKITGNSYRKTRSDLGTWGEYLTFKELEHLEKDGAKFLFNLYIPKSDGTTTEIDVLVITSSGIIVCESKNYSGWIFGSEFQKYWMQTLPKGRKSHKTTFLNPIIQNKGHIKWLKTIVGDEIDIKSVIVFSERCTFKDLNMKSEDIYVIQRFEIDRIVNDFINRPAAKKMSAEQINDLYDKLMVYTQVDEATKQRHIENIKKTEIQGDKLENEATKDNTITELQEETSVKEAVEEEKEEIVVVPAEKEASEMVELEKSEAANNKTCPLCGKELVLRTARYGKYAGREFLGCTGYPKCNYIKNLE